jgi:endonuclease/exonuclease/phosphatase family metal-dependent hydrolase
MVSIPTILWATTLALAPVSLWGEAPPQAATASNNCRAVVDDRGNRRDDGAIVTWSLRPDSRQRERLDQQCRTLGPIVIPTEPGKTPSTARHTSLVVVSWNVHVGGGDLDTLLDQLTAGHLGFAVTDYVLLIEEAHRAGGLVPASIDTRTRVPRRISPHRTDRERQDIVGIARRRGLALYYVPTMRNGRDAPYEDRGNAILSTLPLHDLTAIELPIDRQRRVAISATVQGVDAQSRAWRLRVVTLHLDALVSARRLWIFATGWRGDQARTVIDSLDHAEPAIVVGADLNTWLGGRWESAYRRLAHVWPASPSGSARSWRDAHGRLDYVFFGMRPGWTKESRRLDRHFGSDHRPIIGIVRFGSAPNR